MLSPLQLRVTMYKIPDSILAYFEFLIFQILLAIKNLTFSNFRFDCAYGKINHLKII